MVWNQLKPSGFLAFWLGNALRATAACHSSTSALQKVVRDPTFSASRPSRVQFFISPLATWLRTSRFSEPTFRPSRPTNHWKNITFRDFPNISRTCLLSSNSFSLLLFSSLLFTYIVGSLTSKLPSISQLWPGHLICHFWVNLKCAARSTSLELDTAWSKRVRLPTESLIHRFGMTSHLGIPPYTTTGFPWCQKCRALICKGHLCGAHWSGTWNCHTKPVPLQTWNGRYTIKWSTLISIPKLPLFNAILLLLMGSGWLCKSCG